MCSLTIMRATRGPQSPSSHASPAMEMSAPPLPSSVTLGAMEAHGMEEDEWEVGVVRGEGGRKAEGGSGGDWRGLGGRGFKVCVCVCVCVRGKLIDGCSSSCVC